jgi:hypothetical protein
MLAKPEANAMPEYFYFINKDLCFFNGACQAACRESDKGLFFHAGAAAIKKRQSN